jgi:hypothetical protein
MYHPSVIFHQVEPYMRADDLQDWLTLCVAANIDAPALRTLLEPGRWISTGRVFNYENWPERNRFKELDRLITARNDAPR